MVDGVDEDDVCAKAGNASTAASGNVTRMRLFIINFLRVGGSVWGAPLQHAKTGVLRDFWCVP